MALRLNVNIRPLAPQDLDVIAHIERQSFGDGGWSLEMIRRLLFERRPEFIGFGGYSPTGLLVGYLAYRPTRGERRLENLAVRTSHRRRGVGTQLLGALQRSLAANPRLHRITDVCHERNQAMIGLLRSCGFRATGVERDAYTDGDGYRFEWRPRPSECGDEESSAERFGDDGLIAV